MISLMPYIGGKHRVARVLGEYLRATGADTLVDVFGGSGAVTLNAGFSKRIYNDASGDLVCLFRVLADTELRRQFIRRARWSPPSRALFMGQYETYKAAGFSFSTIADPVERAFCTFYRHMFAFGGKGRCGGFSVSTGDRHGIKEVVRFRNTARRLVHIGQFFSRTLIENLDFADCVAMYGGRPNIVLFADPPYHGTERYYSQSFGATHHAVLANQLMNASAAVVCTYYDCAEVRELYPRSRWDWHVLHTTKNSCFRSGNKARAEEVVLVKRRLT